MDLNISGEATKRESLSLLIEQAYNNVEDISYTLDAKGRDRLSRKIIEFMLIILYNII
jgi:hypothetical protein